MARVLVTRRLPDGGLEPLARGSRARRPDADDAPYTHDELRRRTRARSTRSCALLTDRIDADVLEAGRAAGCASSPTSRSATTTSTSPPRASTASSCATRPGVLDETTADLAFLLILAASRLAHDAEADLRAGRWHGLGDHAVPRPRRARRDARARRLRPHRPGGRAAGRRLRHAGAAPHPPRHRRCRATSPTSTSCSREADIVSAARPAHRRDAAPDRRARARPRCGRPRCS